MWWWQSTAFAGAFSLGGAVPKDHLTVWSPDPRRWAAVANGTMAAVLSTSRRCHCLESWMARILTHESSFPIGHSRLSAAGPGPPPRVWCVVGWGGRQNQCWTSEAKPNPYGFLGGVRRGLAR